MGLTSLFRRWSKARRPFEGFGGGFESRHPGVNREFLKNRDLLVKGIEQDFIKRDGSLNRDVMPVVNTYLIDLKTKSMLSGMNKKEGDACRLSTMFALLNGKNSELILGSTRSETAKLLKATRKKRAEAESYLQTASSLLRATSPEHTGS